MAAAVTMALLGCVQALGFAPFVETGGLVVMEAEHYQTNQASSDHFWASTTNVPGYVSASAMQAQPTPAPRSTP